MTWKNDMDNFLLCKSWNRTTLALVILHNDSISKIRHVFSILLTHDGSNENMANVSTEHLFYTKHASYIALLLNNNNKDAENVEILKCNHILNLCKYANNKLW